MTSEAIVIGVNRYEFLQPLQYAQQDAWAVKTFLEQEAKFDRVYYFAEDAPAVNGVTMKPTRNNLRRVMRDMFARPFMGDGDNFWFFFSGHGMRHGERDFLMPIDGDPDDIAESGIATAQISEWLRGCGADNVVMILDACRSGGIKDGKGIGDETRDGCRQTGVISLFSCSPNQFSYELPRYGQGAFTKVLLEGLGVQGGCATVARLDAYLQRRVPEVVRECLGERAQQLPYAIAEPISKSHLILMPTHARPEDLDTLKMDAFRAENRGDLRLALQCWLRVNIASRGLDPEAIDQIVRLKLKLSQIRSEVPLFPGEAARQRGDLGGSKSGTQPIANAFILDSNPSESITTKTNQTDSVSLDSERGIDYQILRDLLKAGKWEEADKETIRIMLLIADRASQGWLNANSIRKFPCKDLCTIDQLWVAFSDSKFGFSVQIQVWEACGQPISSGKGWDQFCIKVGWKNNIDQGCYSYNNYSTLSKSTLDSPAGELPYNHWITSKWGVWTGSGGASYLVALSQKLLDCNKLLGRSKGGAELPTLPTFKFEYATIDAKLNIQKHAGTAPYYRETLNGFALDLVQIRGGSFDMGSNEYGSEKPIHRVTVSDFFIGIYPVTQAQWQAVAKLKQQQQKLDPDPSHFKGDDRPVEQVSWQDAVEFCDRLSAHTGKRYRLPSEAEWEYACRAGTTTPFHFGETIDAAISNYCAQDWDFNGTISPGKYRHGQLGEFRQETTPVGSFPANVWGLFDCHGNVWEWCEDDWHENYQNAPSDGTAWLAGGSTEFKTLRDGSWNDPPVHCRSANRLYVPRDTRSFDCGFRVVLCGVGGSPSTLHF